MIRISKTFTRPNSNTVWWFQTTDGIEFTAYRNATYGSKLSDPANAVSPNGLSWTYNITWTSEADRNAARADPIFVAAEAKKASYNAANGITEAPSVVVKL
jgi:hypothetical protein